MPTHDDDDDDDDDECPSVAIVAPETTGGNVRLWGANDCVAKMHDT